MILTVSDSISSYAQFMTVLIIFIFVLAVTYLATKWITGYQKIKGRNSNLEIVESFQLASNKYIQIIRVGQKYLAVAIGKDSVTMLVEIPKDQLVFSDDTEKDRYSFKEILEKMQKKNFLKEEDDRNKDE
ncbi:MAG: flagellar biosynthetic protein FliO [Lachnospiraceae bacterium]|nr:flagellar biosynthetic protein FliO [Lachnospiraceae bacterium]